MADDHGASDTSGVPGVDAVVLAGGRSSRLGRPKQDVVVGGATLLERTLAACERARRVVVVGPPRDDLPCEVVQVREEPVLGGPVAALAAALPHVETEHLLVLACDMPRVAEVVRSLRAPGDGTDAVLAGEPGQPQPLAGVYRRSALAAALADRDVDGASMRSVLAHLVVELVAVPPGSVDDVDRPVDLLTFGAATRDPAPLAPSRTVRDAMVTIPTVLPASASVGDVRRFFADDHVHLAVLVEGGRVVTTLDRGDLAGVPDRDAAAEHGRWRGRSVRPGALLQPVKDRMIDAGTRRLVVVDEQRRLLGLLCLKRSLGGFCSDADVLARAADLSGIA